MTTSITTGVARAEFPLTRDWTYVNHASHGPYPRRTVEAVKRYAEAWANPAAFDSSRNEVIQNETKQWLAELAGASPENVAFTGSLADGMNILGNGLDLSSG
ncbi:MAG: hypothetical protein ACOC9Y_04035, partial [Chloroflexota bacterium]